jgi:hypothetical protein
MDTAQIFVQAIILARFEDEHLGQGQNGHEGTDNVVSETANSFDSFRLMAALGLRLPGTLRLGHATRPSWWVRSKYSGSRFVANGVYNPTTCSSTPWLES